MKKKFGTFDGYLAADIMTGASVALFILFIIKRSDSKLWLIAATIAILLLWYAMLVAKTVVKNKSNQSIFTKGENDGIVAECKPGEKATDIDGLKAAGIVYKIPDGVHATVDERNQIKVTSLWGKLIYKVRGGICKMPPDEYWHQLFDI